MDIITILKANIRRQKGSFFSIFILMMIVSLSLNAVLTISINSYKSDADALEHAGFGDMLVMLDASVKEKESELIERVENHKEVEKVQVIPGICGNFKEINGRSNGNTVMLTRYDTANLDYRIFDKTGTEYNEEPKALQSGEMYLPICYSTIYGCKVGKKITFQMDGKNVSYTIKGFFEDPFMGGSMMGIKTILISDTDMGKMLEKINTATTRSLSEGMMLNIFRKENRGLSYLKFEQELNKDTGIAGFAWISLGTGQAMEFMMILVKIFSGSLLVFIVLLLIITLIIMSHSIASSIEMEYVNLGILKAVGVMQGKLKLILMLQYLLGAVAGAIVGIPLAMPVIKMVNQITTPVVGILTPNHLAIVPCMGTLSGIMGCLVLFIWLKMRKLKEITPIRAICGGKESIYFSSPVEMPVRKRGMAFWLALRQLTFNGKQYISAGVITGLLVFFLIMAGHMDAWMGEDAREFVNIFNVAEYDLRVHCYNDEIKDDVEKTIQSYSKIEHQYQAQNMQLMLEGCQIMCFVCEEPEEIKNVLEGRTCRYDNEILITRFVADNLELEIGDTVTVALNDKKEKYMVSGIYQCANDLGNNFAMSKAGYERIGTQVLGEVYCLEDADKAAEIGEKLNDIYGTDLSVLVDTEFNGMDTVAAAVKGISVLVYVLTLIFVFVVISLVCGKIFAKERQDYGIYKALGFTSGNLRRQLALRFVLVSLLGSLLGVILMQLFMNKCFGIMLSYVGISQVETEIEGLWVAVPIGMMAVVFFIFAYWKGRRIKKVQPRVLISE